MSETAEIPSKECICSIDLMSPERISFDLNAHFSHKCETCGGGVTERINTEYNRFWGYSGFDEEGDHEGIEGDYLESDEE